MTKKIDIHVNGIYIASTIQSKTCKEAKNKFITKPEFMGLFSMMPVDITGKVVTAKFHK